MRVFSYIIAILLLTACNHKRVLDEMIIEGNVKNVPDGILYLVEAHNWQVPLDSTFVKDGRFTFKLKADSSFTPYMVSLQFPDSTSPTNVRPLIYRNFTAGADSTKHGFASFMLEKGLTRIEGVYNSNERLRVFAGKETEIMYKNQLTNFGWLNNISPEQRLQRIAFFKDQIRHNPFSYYLLSGIYNAKEQYSEEELLNVLSLFNHEVQASKPGKNIQTYLTLRPDPNEPLANLSLVNVKGERRNIIDSSSKLNMLVFWASWCGPCRQEIPALKQIFSAYTGKRMKMVSISIDEDEEHWRKALKAENMDWPQYIVEPDQIEKVKQQYNFAAIPMVVFTDGKGNEIKRFLGNEPGGERYYHDLIKSILKVK